jgi:hypothetical protein
MLLTCCHPLLSATSAGRTTSSESEHPLASPPPSSGPDASRAPAPAAGQAARRLQQQAKPTKLAVAVKDPSAKHAVKVVLIKREPSTGEKSKGQKMGRMRVVPPSGSTGVDSTAAFAAAQVPLSSFSPEAPTAHAPQSMPQLLPSGSQSSPPRASPEATVTFMESPLGPESPFDTALRSVQRTLSNGSSSGALTSPRIAPMAETWPAFASPSVVHPSQQQQQQQGSLFSLLEPSNIDHALHAMYAAPVAPAAVSPYVQDAYMPSPPVAASLADGRFQSPDTSLVTLPSIVSLDGGSGSSLTSAFSAAAGAPEQLLVALKQIWSSRSGVEEPVGGAVGPATAAAGPALDSGIEQAFQRLRTASLADLGFTEDI